MSYTPPYTITPAMLSDLIEIGELLGRFSVLAEREMTPQLRRGNRIKTIQASLAIENNTLSLEQVTAVLEGKKVVGLPREIQEVRNAFKAYEQVQEWKSTDESHFLKAHQLLTEGLVDECGSYRSRGVGICQGDKVIHMAPPAERVPQLMNELFNWLKDAEEHPIVASSVFHYECEFIHPFSDGNGRIGRLWQTVILSDWKPLWAYLPVESLIKEKQEEYYAALGESDAIGQATPFIQFMIRMLKETILETISNQTRPVAGTKQALSRHQAELLEYCRVERSVAEMMAFVGRSDRTKFRKAFITPLLESGYLEMTIPEKPKSPNQRYVAKQ